MPPEQLPAPASRRLENAEPRFRFRRQIHRGSSLRRGVSPLFNLSAVLLRSSIDGSSRSRSVEISSRVLVNHQLAVFNRTSWSRSVKRSSAELVNPLFDSVCVRRSPAIPIQRLSKVLVSSLFTVFTRSRSAKISSAELVVVVSLPQRRTREKKQLITPIRDFAPEKSQGERRVWNLKKRVGELRSEIETPIANIEEAIKRKRFRGAMAEIDSWSRSMDTNLCSVFSKPEHVVLSSLVTLPLAVLRLVLGSAPMDRLCQAISSFSEMSFSSTFSSHSAMDANVRVMNAHFFVWNLATVLVWNLDVQEQEEPENPPGKSTKSKKVKAGLSQYAIQKFVEEKHKTLKNAKKKLNSKFAEFVEGTALHESPKNAADFSLIPEAVDDYQFGDSNEKFVFPFLPSSDKGGHPDLSFVSSGIASDIYSAGISSTYQCQNSEAKIPETEMAIKHLRRVRNQVMNSTDVDLQSKRLMDAVIDVSAEVLWFTRKEEMLRLPMLKKCLLFLLWILAVFFDSLTAWMKGMVFLGVHSMDAS
nr:GPI-anchored adhesin-like protein precursor [Ipomoea batatas]